MSSAVFTGLGVYAAWQDKPHRWIVAASIVVGVVLFYVAAFFAWSDEYKRYQDVIADHDPCIYVKIFDETIQMARRTPFELDNRGKSVAHRIQIQPLELTVGRATVREVDSLAAGEKVEAVPIVEGASALFRHDLFNFLHREANKIELGSVKEFVVNMSATYEDVTGTRHFKVSFDVMYSPLNKMLFDNHPLLKDSKPIYEVRNTTIRLVRADG